MQLLLNDKMDNIHNSVLHPHHIPVELCRNRATYRQGKRLTAVKVYTVSKESSHLLIFNVPAIRLNTELQLLCERFGKIVHFEKLPQQHELEEFTNVFHINYLKVPSARYAKKHMDNRSFYGGILHVCYAPEKETLEETRIKLVTRRNEIAVRTGRKLKAKNLQITRSNNFYKNPSNFSDKIGVDMNRTNAEMNQIMEINEDKDVSCCVHQNVPLKLTPTVVLKRRGSAKGESQKKLARIVFHNK